MEPIYLTEVKEIGPEVAAFCTTPPRCAKIRRRQATCSRSRASSSV